MRFQAWLRTFLWHLRHKEFRNVETVTATGGDDTANIQGAIDRAAHTSPWAYEKAKYKYDRSRLKWLRRKPVLKSIAFFAAGEYEVRQEIHAPMNVVLQGASTEETIIRSVR